ncbi:hypothetical protein BJ912DRAFT_927015 [Pholiota molesta]|nr:hypothetical protein BJ912DRAFT_927015 [Pholiota molesta]
MPKPTSIVIPRHSALLPCIRNYDCRRCRTWYKSNRRSSLESELKVESRNAGTNAYVLTVERAKEQKGKSLDDDNAQVKLAATTATEPEMEASRSVNEALNITATEPPAYLAFNFHCPLAPATVGVSLLVVCEGHRIEERWHSSGKRREMEKDKGGRGDVWEDSKEWTIFYFCISKGGVEVVERRARSRARQRSTPKCSRRVTAARTLKRVHTFRARPDQAHEPRSYHDHDSPAHMDQGYRFTSPKAIWKLVVF